MSESEPAPNGPGSERVEATAMLGGMGLLVAANVAVLSLLIVLWPPVRTASTPPAVVSPPASPPSIRAGSPTPSQVSPSASPSGPVSPSASPSGTAATPSPSASPTASPSANPTASPSPVATAGACHAGPLSCAQEDERRLLLVVMLAGALGSLIHALRSFAWYVGNRTLVRSWVPWYGLLPFTGASLAAIFYFVVRGGFFAPSAQPADTSPFGFIAVGALVGMFSVQAILKLKSVAETLLEKPAPGKNPAPPQGPSEPKPPSPAGPPQITQVTREAPTASGESALVVTGSGFREASRVEIDGVAHPARFLGPDRLVVPLVEEDLARLRAGRKLTLQVVNPDGTRSATHEAS